ncbi:unnamed protein product, partial [Allacma fusca]
MRLSIYFAAMLLFASSVTTFQSYVGSGEDYMITEIHVAPIVTAKNGTQAPAK